MRTLFVGALAATLVGCSCFVSPQTGLETCTGPDSGGYACLNRTAAGLATEPEPTSLEPNPVRHKTKRKIAAKKEKPSPAQSRDKIPVDTETAKPAATAAKVETETAKSAATAAKVEPETAKSAAPAAKFEPPASRRTSEAPDPVMVLAKITVAAKLANPASAEFSEMKRAMRTNTLGQSVDTICGRVKGKKASGEGTEEKPFLYLVKDNEAYVVEGSPSSPGAIAYGNICN